MQKNIILALKILNLLGEGFQLKFERSKRGRRAIHEACDRTWHSIDRKHLYYVLDQLRLKEVIRAIKEGDNIEKMALTNKSRAYSLKQRFKIVSLKNPQKRAWDKKWRIVLFDIPEKFRSKRDALRKKLKSLGFLEFQKSTFVYPFSCEDEIHFIINFLEIPEYVYYIEAPIVPDHRLRKHFKL